jgi:molecular chaperone IbpA
MTSLRNFPLNDFIGFEQLFKMLENSPGNSNGGYPPFNAYSDNETDYVIEMAVAGFSFDDISIEVKENTLIVEGSKPANPVSGRTYIHNGISNKKFSRTFNLAADIVVRAASLDDGMLSIYLERIIPEEKKPRRIQINTRQSHQLLEE